MAEVANLAVRVGADISPLAKDMKRAGRHVESFSERTKRAGRRITALGKQATLAAAGIGALSAAFLAAGKKASGFAVEIDNLAKLSNTGVEEFQRLAAASDTVGISQEKLADIFKDVNDKVGDFLTTGGGPMADFFEQIAPQVGVTADQFARLSGPEALQLYVSSLEKANLSQQKMTFFLEAIASDATALLPLLRGNGAEFARLGQAAQDAGHVLDKEMIAKGVELDKMLSDLTRSINLEFNAAVIGSQNELYILAQFIEKQVIPVAKKLVEWFAEVANIMGAAADAWREFQGLPPQGSQSGPKNPLIIDNGPGRPAGLPGSIFDEPSPPVGPFTGAGIPDSAIEAAKESYGRSVAAAREHADAIKAIDREVADSRRTTWGDMFGALEGLAGAGSKKLFKLSQAAAAANAIINTHEGITKALAKNDLRMAAVVAVRGAASLAAIKGASVGGGGGGGAAGLSGAGAVPQTSNQVNLQIVGDTVPVDRLRDAVNTLNDAHEAGYRLNFV